MLTTLLCKGTNWSILSRPIGAALFISKNFICSSSFPNKTSTNVVNRVKLFAEREGRQPRILVSSIDRNGLNFDSMGIATGFADLGFDVDVGPQHLSPEEAAQQSVNADAHAVAACNVATEYLSSVSALRKELNRLGRPDMLVVANGKISKEHRCTLYGAGVSAVFGHKVDDISNCALQILNELEWMLAMDDNTAF